VNQTKPNNWEIVKLGDAATFINGYAFKPSDWSTEGLEIIRIQNLTKGSSDTNYFNGEIKDRYKVKFGDLLISWSATLGIYLWKGKDAWLNQHLFKVVFDKKTFDKQFFKYLISTSLHAMGRETHGSTMKHITKVKFDRFKIPYPPLPEQQKIASILDAADSLRQKDQQMIEKYTALSQSLFLDMFGDVKHNHNDFKITTVGDVISEIKDGPHVSPKYSDKGIPILSTRNIRPFSLVLNELKYVSTEMYETLTKRFSPQKGDVLLTKGGTTGYAKVVDFDWKFCIWVHIAALRPKTDLISAKYLEAALNSHYCYHQSQLLTKGIANKDLGLKRIVNIILLLPPLTLQNQFAERIQAIEAQKQQAQASLQKSEDLFNSLLQRAFKGELTA